MMDLCIFAQEPSAFPPSPNRCSAIPSGKQGHKLIYHKAGQGYGRQTAEQGAGCDQGRVHTRLGA